MHNQTAKCSIIIPVYNGEKFLKKTIESCLRQTICCEIIVINDASTDNSEQIVQSYKETGIIYIKNDTNIGLMKSYNKAAVYASSDYLLFLGHDDMLSPQHVELTLSEFNDKTSFVHCNAYLIDENDSIFGIGVNDKKQLHRTKYAKIYLTAVNIIHSTGTIINKKYFNQVGGWEEKYKNYGEWLLWIKLANVGHAKYTTKCKTYYRRHQTNITNTFKEKNVKKKLSQYFRACRLKALKNLLNF